MQISVLNANYLWLYVLPHTDPFINTEKGNHRKGTMRASLYRCRTSPTDPVSWKLGSMERRYQLVQ